MYSDPMSRMKQVLEVIESDEELKKVYESILVTSVSYEMYAAVMDWIYDEALTELKN